MSTATDALLFYGFLIPGGPDEGCPFWKRPHPEYPACADDTDETDSDEFIAAKYGLPQPATPYSEAAKDEYIAYWNAKRALLKPIGVEVETHCSGSYTMYALAISASRSIASRGDPIEFEALPVADPTWNQKLRDFCEKTGAPFSAPRWILASWWDQ